MDDAFIKLVTIEVTQTMIIRAEVARYPVEYDSDAFFMECLDKMLQSVCGSVP